MTDSSERSRRGARLALLRPTSVQCRAGDRTKDHGGRTITARPKIHLMTDIRTGLARWCAKPLWPWICLSEGLGFMPRFRMESGETNNASARCRIGRPDDLLAAHAGAEAMSASGAESAYSAVTEGVNGEDASRHARVEVPALNSSKAPIRPPTSSRASASRVRAWTSASVPSPCPKRPPKGLSPCLGGPYLRAERISLLSGECRKPGRICDKGPVPRKSITRTAIERNQE
jgi:hypothetical protein